MEKNLHHLEENKRKPPTFSEENSAGNRQGQEYYRLCDYRVIQLTLSMKIGIYHDDPVYYELVNTQVISELPNFRNSCLPSQF